MSKNVLIISTSLRTDSNSAMLAEEFFRGAKDSGHNATMISLKDKQIEFCRGCLACQKTVSCVIHDDVKDIETQMLAADVVVWATPIYYYEMSGQMKTLIDRLNPMYPKDYAFRDVYLLATAAEDEPGVPERAVAGLTGWIDCFDKASFKGIVFCGGVNGAGDIHGNRKLQEAYDLGKNC